MRSSITTETERIKQYLAETYEAKTSSDISTYLGLSDSAVGGYLTLMIAFGTVVKRRKGRNFFFLKDKFTEEEMAALLPPDKPKRIPRRPRRQFVPGKIGRPRNKTESQRFRDDLIADIDKRASSGGLPALAILGLPDIEDVRSKLDLTKIEEITPLQKKQVTIRASSMVSELPKNVRRLPKTELNYLKKILQQYPWYKLIANMNTGYVKFKALKNGRYGDELYFSKGSNAWDDIIQISIDSSISGNLILPTQEISRWNQWKDFSGVPRKPRKLRSNIYGEMLDEFIESGHKLVEITIENKNPAYVRHNLYGQILIRQLQDQIHISRVEQWIYLERIEGTTND